MDTVLVFAKGITLSDVNPHNFSMKNGYVSNIICTCVPVLPMISSYIDTLKCITGFMSSGYIAAHYPKEAHSPEMKLHSQGKAIKITWPNFNSMQAIDILIKIISDLPEDIVDITFIVSESDKSVAIYYGLKKGKSIIEEYFEGKTKKERYIYS